MCSRRIDVFQGLIRATYTQKQRAIYNYNSSGMLPFRKHREIGNLIYLENLSILLHVSYSECLYLLTTQCLCNGLNLVDVLGFHYKTIYLEAGIICGGYFTDLRK